MASASLNGPATPPLPREPAEGGRDSQQPDPCADVLGRLAGREGQFRRYRIEEEIGRGGMGRVLRVLDGDLLRHLAMKVLRAPEEERVGTPRSPSRSRHLARFLEEAQINGQLDHPGIVPVHELGLDPDGHVYFTMKLVRGRTLTEVIDLVRREAEGWSTVRAVGVLLKVCEAMSYAHERNVIHRDLKPGNIMVGRFGEVFVMDWGLARVLTQGAGKGSEVLEPARTEATVFYSQRHAYASKDAESPLVTMEGDVLGTPAYMSPEQASGHVTAVGPQSDVYSAGAILYHVLSGSMPYVEEGRKIDNHEIWRRLQTRPPAPIAALAPRAPAELLAICEKAMERDLARRYATMHELVDELRAFLENRVVRAHKSGPLIEMRKWVQRHRGVAAASAAALLVAIAGGFLVAWKERQRAEELTLNLDEHLAASLLQQADDAWPVHPRHAPEMEAWLALADGLLERRTQHAERLARTVEAASADGSAREVPAARASALQFAIEDATHRASEMQALLEVKRAALERGELDGSKLTDAVVMVQIWPREIGYWRERGAELQSAAGPATAWTFDSPVEQALYERELGLASALDALATHARPRVEARLTLARELEVRTLADARAKWDEACASIADPAACPLYAGARIAPQLGLVPLRRDPHSGLWEFWHVLSGEAPTLDDQGRWRIGSETGIVLVLVPGDRAWIGADAKDPRGVNHDPRASATEKPQQVELAPFFISKYELTQGQWFRATGELPARWYSGVDTKDNTPITRTHPVEWVSWEECTRVLAAWSLALPTEPQWEHAARGGTHTAYWTGADFASLQQSTNFGDAALARTPAHLDEPTEAEDGFRVHAPVGTYPANPFGLHEVLGNVSEWCRDWYTDACDKTVPRPVDGERIPPFSRTKVYRGGGWTGSSFDLRVSRRCRLEPEGRDESLGVRPARALDS